MTKEYLILELETSLIYFKNVLVRIKIESQVSSIGLKVDPYIQEALRELDVISALVQILKKDEKDYTSEGDGPAGPGAERMKRDAEAQ